MAATFTIRHAQIDPARVQHRLVRNPNYGGPRVSLNNWCITPVTPATRKVKFFEALRESVRREGLRNPIVVYALPEGLFLSFGCSRLRVAQELGLPEIPALVVDYTGEFADAEEVTQANWQGFFRDPPRHFEFTSDGIDTHYSLERNRRAAYDAAGFAWCGGVEAEFIKDEFGWING